MGAQARVADFDGERAYVLRAADGTEAWVLPSIGANCIALRVPLADGRDGSSAHVLASPPSAAALRAHPTGAGFPILAPHPGQNRSPFTWRGRTYDPGSGRGRLPGHGFAARAAWAVIDANETTLVSRLDTRQTGDDAAYWPWPFTLTVTHHVEPGALTLSCEVDNLASGPAPLLFGLHPYFPLRLHTPQAGGAPATNAIPAPEELAGGDETSARRTCRVWVESGELVDLDRGMATGMVRPVEARWDVRHPRSLADLAEAAGAASRAGRAPLLLYGKREALAALGGEDPAAPGGVTSGVVDTTAGLAVRLETSRAFGTVALYCPDKPAVSLEPRTALPDALTVAAADPQALTGLRAVEPGIPWRAWARVSLTTVPTEMADS